MNILIAEDERGLADALAQILRRERYVVDVVYNGADALAYVTGAHYDAFICDVMLPGMSGFDVVRQARAAGVSTPTIMLTARTATMDKVTGLDAGADDYMTKPFQPIELLARLRALTRRQGEVVMDELRVGDLVLNLSTCDLSCNGGEPVHLSFKEFEVLRLLMSNARVTVSKETIIARVWGADSAEENNVEAYISFLRKKLKFLGSTVQIVTQRMMGYRLEDAA
ncbi:MAG: response regulator transcription factor [Coriobacteriales bacterium]